MKNDEKLDHGETMATMWAGFEGKCLNGCSPLQVAEMEKAFYAGALCLFNWFMVQLDPEAEPTDADMAKVSAMEQEIDAFFERQRP